MQDALQGNERGLVSDPQGLDLDEKPKRSPPDFQKNKQSNIIGGVFVLQVQNTGLSRLLSSLHNLGKSSG